MEPSRKRSSIRSLLAFRSSKQTSPRASIDETASTRSSLDIDYAEDVKLRRASVPLNASPMSKTQTNSFENTGGSNKLRKKSVLTLENSRKNPDSWDTDRNTGERKDSTNMLHAIAHDFDAPQQGRTPIMISSEPAQLATEFTNLLPDALWQRIISVLPLPDEASLSLSCKPFQKLCNDNLFRQLSDPDNFRLRCEFLYRLNDTFPDHLLCYICGIYHLRTQAGKESLRPTNIANPVFNCPYATATEPDLRVSKHRITFGRHIPYPFVQLALRHHHHGPQYGVQHDTLLGRRYHDKESIGSWSHQTRYAIIDSHLYMRVVSSTFVTPSLPLSGKRHLLYSREDFIPYFSVCAHWRDGDLTPICKCALDHVPTPLSGSGINRVANETVQKFRSPQQSQIVSQCDFCKPLRRCPECPTEYLVEVRLQEDRTERDPMKLFKHALMVTRWSDLGDGLAPWEPHWAALQGALDELPKEQRYDSFAELGRRAISGTFESWFNPEQIPPARLISLNPGGERLGEKGHGWY